VVSVRDTGVGIPPDMLTQVFDLFIQVDRSLERAQGGLGIGLSLVRRLVEMHGGKVEAHSEGIDKGSELVVRLPIASGAGAASPMPHVDAGRRVTCRRILVVDDNLDSANSLAMILGIMGHVTQTAHDGVAALDVAASFRPEVVLLDIGMPGLNGYETARRLRHNTWAKDVMLVALTGFGQEADRARSCEAGFNAHLVKPVHAAAIHRLLASLSAADAEAGAGASSANSLRR
jgi:CheY-like chemotaxis protein